MFITKKSELTGNVHTIDIPVTDEQIDAWMTGTFIQDAMPHISADHREFLMTGITPDEWERYFGKDE
jgi:hypothetical protein